VIETKDVVTIINYFNRYRLDRLRAYYDGWHDILERYFEDETKPNNKIVTNFCKIVADTNVNHFMGVPVTYGANEDHEKALEELQEIFNYNNEQNVNSKLAKYASIYSRAYEILYVTEDSDGNTVPAFRPLDLRRQSVYVKYADTLEQEIEWALRWFEETDPIGEMSPTPKRNPIRAFLYTKDEVIEYVVEDGMAREVDREVHYFGEVPINVYWNKEPDGHGDFEDIMTLNDAYNILNSDDINESEYSNDAYLVIKNLAADEEDLQDLKEKRAITVGKEGDVRWLMKDMDATWKNSLKDRLREDIFSVAGTPDMTDENFAGTSSGEALKYKLLNFENNRSDKERMFKEALGRRIRMIFNFIKAKGRSYDWRAISMRFSANLPKNLVNEADLVNKLAGKGIASKQTLRSVLSIIEDPAKEKERIEDEQEAPVLDDPQDPPIPEDEDE